MYHSQKTGDFKGNPLIDFSVSIWKGSVFYVAVLANVSIEMTFRMIQGLKYSQFPQWSRRGNYPCKQ